MLIFVGDGLPTLRGCGRRAASVNKVAEQPRACAGINQHALVLVGCPLACVWNEARVKVAAETRTSTRNRYIYTSTAVAFPIWCHAEPCWLSHVTRVCRQRGATKPKNKSQQKTLLAARFLWVMEDFRLLQRLLL